MALSNVQITPQLVQAVRDAVDILSIASEHTKLRRSGQRYTGLCPLHKEKSPSFSVDENQGLFYCFGCGAGGDAIKLHMLLSGDDFPAAIESLAGRYGIALPTAPRRRGETPERDLEAVLGEAAKFFAAQLRGSTFALGYLEKRKIPADLIERFGLGYAPDGWRGLLEALRAKVAVADLEAAGLVAKSDKPGGEHYDRFRHRLMFPIRNASGRLVGFGGRALGDDKAKYVNTSETERFHKGFLLYGLDSAKKAIREAGRALLVEGYFDVIASVASGVEGTVASMGTALTPEQTRLLARYADEIVVGYDGDEAGENASRRALGLLLAEGLGVRRAIFGAGHDPDSLRLEKGPEAVLKAVTESPDLVSLELDRLIPPDTHRNPRLRAKAATAVAELLKPIRDSILRYGYGRVAADRLAVPVELLWKRLGVDRDTLAAVAGGSTGPSRFPAAETRKLVRSLEERTLQMLLAGVGSGAERVAVEELPAPEAFFDLTARNIFEVFSRLYSRKSDTPPGPREVLAELAADGAVIDRMAQLLLENDVSPKPGELRESLRQLERRWQQQRLRDLGREIHEAQRLGDAERLTRLLGEKTSLSRTLHTPSPRQP
ncbi:MAG: DNA primase [Acidobacteriota bacterium]